MPNRMLKFLDLGSRSPDKRGAETRRRDFDEIYQEYDPAAAAAQAARCSQCGIPFCQVHCPVQNNIPDWLMLTAEGRLEEAYELSQATNNFPEICGRICPQDRLCEGNCVIEQAGHGTVTIGAVERYITETAWQRGWVKPVKPRAERERSVGIIGAGPGGLAAAEELRRKGYQVHVYDRYDRIGGLLVYGIPNFKLEKDVVERRAGLLRESGVSFHLECEVGRHVTIEELRQRHDAVLIATGVYTARAIKVPGVGLDGAPDLRGYGGSDKPDDVEAYDMASMMADVIGIIDGFGEPTAILVGHDWGAPICWNTAALHADRIAAVAALSVPYRRRGKVSGIELWRRIYADKFFYQLYFQDEGVAEAELEKDVRTSLRKIYFALSGDAPSLDNWLQRPVGGTLLEVLADPQSFPSWLTPEDLDYFTANFEAGGFRGPINRYRNQERDFENPPDMGVRPVAQPSCFIAGAKDIVRRFVPDHDLYENLATNCSDLRFGRIVDGAGHWVQQEAPRQVNEALLEFLASL